MPPSRRRILHVYKDYWPPVVGGIEKTIHYLAHGCADEYDVSVLVCARSGRSSVERDGPITIHKTAEWGRVASASLSPLFPFRLRALKADILHFHHPNPTGEIAWLLARPSGRVVVTYHSDIVRQRLGLALYTPLLRRFLRQADVLLPTSPDYMRSSPFLRPLADRCRPVPLGIPLDRFAPTPERLAAAARIRERIGGASPIALFVGQFREYKGLKFFIEALAHVDGVTAILIGDGPCRGEVEESIARLGLAGRVHLPGRLPDDEVIDHYHACDVFVLPSHRRSEAFGIAQVEAMACGKPVIGTRLDTGVAYVNRDGETGLLVEPANPAVLAEALRRIAGDDALRRRFGEAARERAHREFSVETLVARVKDVYASLFSPPGVD